MLSEIDRGTSATLFHVRRRVLVKLVGFLWSKLPVSKRVTQKSVPETINWSAQFCYNSNVIQSLSLTVMQRSGVLGAFQWRGMNKFVVKKDTGGSHQPPY